METRGKTYESISTTTQAANVDEIEDVLLRGSQNRAVAETKLNAQSSRSHAIVRVCVKGRNQKSQQETVGETLITITIPKAWPTYRPNPFNTFLTHVTGNLLVKKSV